MFQRFDPVMVEALCTWFFFRGIGYDPKDVYFGTARCPHGLTMVQMIVRNKERSLAVDVATVPYPSELAFARWLAIAESFNQGLISQNEMKAFFRGSTTRRIQSTLIELLRQNEFPISPVTASEKG
jgi:hypothetical protein